MLLLVFTHIDARHCILVVEKKISKRIWSTGLHLKCVAVVMLELRFNRLCRIVTIARVCIQNHGRREWTNATIEIVRQLQITIVGNRIWPKIAA